MAGPEPEVAEEADHPPLSRGEAAEETGEEVVNVEAVKGVPDTRPHPQRPVANATTFMETKLFTALHPSPVPGSPRWSPSHESPTSLGNIEKTKFKTTHCYKM